jgi:predicted dienelactone hydrolase
VLLPLRTDAWRPPPLAGAGAAWLAAGSFAFAERERVLRDESRPTAARGEQPELPFRELRTTVWMPATGGPHPLIVSVHGFSAGRHAADYLAQALARLGYVVAAANHPLTQRGAPGGPDVRDVVNQPGDVRFLIDRMLAASEDAADPLFGRIDPERIGVLGISLGGLTATMAAFDPQRRDERIKAVASLAGPTSPFGEKYFRRRPVPMMLVAGSADAVVDYEANAPVNGASCLGSSRLDRMPLIRPNRGNAA